MDYKYRIAKDIGSEVEAFTAEYSADGELWTWCKDKIVIVPFGCGASFVIPQTRPSRGAAMSDIEEHKAVQTPIYEYEAID